MPLIDKPIDDIPTQIDPISAGEHTLLVRDVKKENDPKHGPIIVAEFSVDEPDSEEHERRAWDRFYITYAPAEVKFGNFCRAAGFTSGLPEPHDLIDTTVRAQFKDDVYVDKDTGESKQNTKIVKYLYEV